MKKPQPKHIVMAALFAACALVLVFTHHDDDELVEATPRPAQPASRKPRRAAPMPNAAPRLRPAPSRSPRSARAPNVATPAPTRCSTR